METASLKLKFDIIIIRSESLSSVRDHNQKINVGIFDLKLTQESRNIIKVQRRRTRTSLLLASKV